MKLSVSVPDELWASARALVGEAGHSPSAVVQEALTTLTNGSPTGLPYARRPAGAEDLLQEARKNLLVGAQQDYEAGYSAAQSGFPTLTWTDLNHFARHQFKLRAAFLDWDQAVIDGDGESASWESSFNLLNRYALAVGREVFDSSDGDQGNEKRTTAFLDGFRDALRDAYDAVAGGVVRP